MSEQKQLTDGDDIAEAIETGAKIFSFFNPQRLLTCGVLAVIAVIVVITLALSEGKAKAPVASSVETTTTVPQTAQELVDEQEALVQPDNTMSQEERRDYREAKFLRNILGTRDNPPATKIRTIFLDDYTFRIVWFFIVVSIGVITLLAGTFSEALAQNQVLMIIGVLLIILGLLIPNLYVFYNTDASFWTSNPEGTVYSVNSMHPDSGKWTSWYVGSTVSVVIGFVLLILGSYDKETRRFDFSGLTTVITYWLLSITTTGYAGLWVYFTYIYIPAEQSVPLLEMLTLTGYDFITSLVWFVNSILLLIEASLETWYGPRTAFCFFILILTIITSLFLAEAILIGAILISWASFDKESSPGTAVLAFGISVYAYLLLYNTAYAVWPFAQELFPEYLTPGIKLIVETFGK